MAKKIPKKIEKIRPKLITEKRKIKNIKTKPAKIKKNKIKNNQKFPTKIKSQKQNINILLNNISKNINKENTILIQNGLTITIETNDSIIKKYNDINNNNLAKLKDDDRIKKLNKIINDNTKEIYSEKLLKMGKELYDLLTSMKIKDNIRIKNVSEKFIYGKSLGDIDFMDIVKERVKYISSNYDKNYINILKNEFIKYETEIKNIFVNNKLMKDIKENAIISILYLEKYDKKDFDNNFSFLGVQNITTIPLINIPMNLTKNNDFDLNKKNILNICLSYIPFTCYKNTMNKFINNYNLNNKELRSHIINYIKLHEFYFCNLKDDIQGINIHTGDIFLNIKYLKQYINEVSMNNKLIISEKIFLIILHEVSHGLIRTINKEMNSNFLINSEIKLSKIRNLIFKSIENKNDRYKISINEVGNYFDYLIFNKYYFEYISPEVAKIFKKIKTFQSKQAYNEELTNAINISTNDNLTNINNFKFNYKKKIAQCFYSIMRSGK